LVVSTVDSTQDHSQSLLTMLRKLLGGLKIPELFCAMAVAVAGILAIRLVLHTVAIGKVLVSPILSGLSAPWALTMLVVVGLGYLAAERRHARVLIAALAGLAAALLTIPLTLGLWSTDQPLDGVMGGDNAFRTEYVTRFASSWKLQDYMFLGKNAFYPPAWFWVAARWADVTGIAPYQALRPMAIATQALALLAAFVLWRMSARPAPALAASIASALIASHSKWDPVVWRSPYSVFVAVVLVPWFVAAYAWLSDPRSRPGRTAILIGVGALLTLTYYILFVIALAALAAVALPSVVRRTQEWLRFLLLAMGVAVLTAVFWVPFVADVLSGTPTQGTYFVPEFVEVETGFDIGWEIALFTVAAAGLLLLTLHVSRSRALLILGISTILYQVLSALMLVVLHQQLLAFRAAVLFLVVVGASVPLGLDALTAGGGLRRQETVPIDTIRAVPTVVAGVLLLPLFSIAVAYASPLFNGDSAQRAHPRFDPRGPDALHQVIVDNAGAPAQNLVVASADPTLVVLYPFWSFVPWNIHYAHPRAQVPERVQNLQRAAACPDASCFDSVMAASPFGHIDAFVLRQDQQGLLGLDTQLPGFPTPAAVSIKLDSRVFAPERWKRVEAAGYVVYVRAPGT